MLSSLWRTLRRVSSRCPLMDALIRKGTPAVNIDLYNDTLSYGAEIGVFRSCQYENEYKHYAKFVHIYAETDLLDCLSRVLNTLCLCTPMWSHIRSEVMSVKRVWKSVPIYIYQREDNFSIIPFKVRKNSMSKHMQSIGRMKLTPLYLHGQSVDHCSRSPIEEDTKFVLGLSKCPHFDSTVILTSVPSKAVCREIGSTDFVKISTKDAFSWSFSQFLA